MSITAGAYHELSFAGIASQIRKFSKSVQQVEVTIPAGSTSATAAVPTPVDKTKSYCVHQNKRSFGSVDGNTNGQEATIELTTGSLVTAKIGVTCINDVIVRIVIIETLRGIMLNCQHGEITIAGGSSSASITPGFTPSADLNTLYCWLGQRSVHAGQDIADMNASLSYNFGTNSLTATRGFATATDSLIVGYCIFEFTKGIIKSKQDIAATIPSGSTTHDTTISSVDLTKAVTFYGGFSAQGDFQPDMPAAYLSGATKITSTRFSSASKIATSRMIICEFDPKYLKSVQRGLSAFLSTEATHDITIAAVNTAKAYATFTGHFFQNGFSNTDYTFATNQLNSSTILRGKRMNANTAYGSPISGYTPTTFGWEVPEFY